MAWTTPVLVEICIGLEINGYLPAEFYPLLPAIPGPSSCLDEFGNCPKVLLLGPTNPHTSLYLWRITCSVPSDRHLTGGPEPAAGASF